MSDKLLAEFPETNYDDWRQQVDKDLKGADFQKRLVTRTLEGIDIQPLYTARDTARPAGLTAQRHAAFPAGKHGAQWDIRAEIAASQVGRAKQEVQTELARGASSLWLRFDRSVRTGPRPDASASTPDGVPCESVSDLAELLAEVDLKKVSVVLDAGANTPALAAAYLAYAAQRGNAAALSGGLGCDPIGALARDGRSPYSLEVGRELAVELVKLTQQRAPNLRSLSVDVTPYHDAGASNAQELAYALSTAVAYLRWLGEAGSSLEVAAAQLEFRVGVAGDLFAELAKLRALRLCFAKLIAAGGGDDSVVSAKVHAVTSRRTKTLRDPWVNMLRTTTEAFSAMVGGADALTTRGFDEALGPSEPFARRIARNVQVILNEEAHVTQVVDAAGGSYYLESLTEALAREAWQIFQKLEADGGILAGLQSGRVQAAIAVVAEKRDQAIKKRLAPITGVSEFANLHEERLTREVPPPDPVGAQNRARLAQLRAERQSEAPVPLRDSSALGLPAAGSGKRLEAALSALASGSALEAVTRALTGAAPGATLEPLPVRRHSAGFETLRARAEAATAAGKPVRGFLANLGPIPKHKARASFASGFLNAGGIAALDNDGFETPDAVVAAFQSAGTKLVVLCGSDDQYPEWVPGLAPALRAAGAELILLAGRPGEHEAAFRAAGVSDFIFMGADIAGLLASLLDRLGVTP